MRAMDDRTFIEWDKDDIDTLGLMKVDVLALGMLTCLRRGLRSPQEPLGEDCTLAQHPAGGCRRSTRCCRRPIRSACSRSRAGRRCRCCRGSSPKTFYDLVIEVAIVRPGPIQGDMVHPYLRRRDGIEKADYPSPDPAHGPADELEDVLSRTLGVPLFQEQAMQIAITAAGFTPGEADGLRRAMATFRHNGNDRIFIARNSSTA